MCFPLLSHTEQSIHYTYTTNVYLCKISAPPGRLYVQCSSNYNRKYFVLCIRHQFVGEKQENLQKHALVDIAPPHSSIITNSLDHGVCADEKFDSSSSSSSFCPPPPSFSSFLFFFVIFSYA